MKEADVIETLPEEINGNAEEDGPELSLASRNDVKRRSKKRPHRRHSIRRG